MSKNPICDFISKHSRVSSDERHRLIVEAAAPLFAEKGFAGTTTKEIAKAAGVSEALLYRHFASKEALYKEMQILTCGDMDEGADMIFQLPPSTDTLIVSVYYFYHHIYLNDNHDINFHKTKKRLILHSLLEDGTFTRSFLEHYMEPIVEKFSACIEAGIQSGEIVDRFIPKNLGTWFGHHLVAMLSSMRLPESDVVNYGHSKEEILVHAVRFTLRGIGMKDEVLEKKVTAESLAARIVQLKSK